MLLQLRSAVFTILLFLFAGMNSQAQTTIHVPADASTIQGAIDGARDGDTVLVSPGVYRENLDFKGKAITVTSGAKSYSDAAGVVIDGSAKGPVVTFATNEPAQAALNGFTIQNGTSLDQGSSQCGGVSIDNASPTLANNLITGNQWCGLSVSNGASPTITGNDVKGNPGYGILINTAGDVTLSQNVVEENRLTVEQISLGGSGTGILALSHNSNQFLAASSLVMNENIVRNNAGGGSTGFMQQGGSAIKNLTMVNNLFYGNTEQGGRCKSDLH